MKTLYFDFLDFTEIKYGITYQLIKAQFDYYHIKIEEGEHVNENFDRTMKPEELSFHGIEDWREIRLDEILNTKPLNESKTDPWRAPEIAGGAPNELPSDSYHSIPGALRHNAMILDKIILPIKSSFQSEQSSQYSDSQQQESSYYSSRRNLRSRYQEEQPSFLQISSSLKGKSTLKCKFKESQEIEVIEIGDFKIVI